MLVTIPLGRRGRDRWNIAKERNNHPQSVDLTPGNGHLELGKSQVILFYAREEKSSGRRYAGEQKCENKGGNMQIKAGGIHLHSTYRSLHVHQSSESWHTLTGQPTIRKLVRLLTARDLIDATFGLAGN